MTVTDETTQLEAVESDENETSESESESTSRGSDFSKIRPYHEELAAYINANSGLDPVTPNQVKAVLKLRTDYGNTDEAKAAREQRKAERAAEQAKYEGMTDEQKKNAKAANRAQAQADRLAAKAQEAIARAQQLRNAAAGSGEDLQAVVESNQNGSDTESADPDEAEEPRRRGLGRRR